MTLTSQPAKMTLHTGEYVRASVLMNYISFTSTHVIAYLQQVSTEANDDLGPGIANQETTQS